MTATFGSVSHTDSAILKGRPAVRPRMDGESVVRAYYRALDDHDYEAFADRLAADVVHRRPDRTIDGRETLVAFMRDDRPDKETSHEVRRMYGGAADGDAGDGDATDDAGVVVEGRLLDAAGRELFAFADAFSLADDAIAEIRTYTR